MLHNVTRSLPKKQTSFKTIFFIEDDASVVKLLAFAISSETRKGILLVSNGQEALQLLKDIIPDLIVLDDHLSKIDGLAFYDLIHSIKGQEETPVAFLSAATPLDGVKEIEHREAVLIEKSFELNDLFDVMQYAYDKS